MELKALYIENDKVRLKLRFCNNDQKPRNQKWKFEYHNSMQINSRESPRLTPSVILQWHRNLTVFGIPLPSLPPIIQRANTVETLIDEPTAHVAMTPETTTTTKAATSTTTTMPELTTSTTVPT
jgi:hypothetical protein